MSDPSAPHRIRLRGPWLRWSGTLANVQQAVRVTVPEPSPAAAPEANPSGTDAVPIFYRRAFNRPSGLTAATQLQLVLREVPELSAVYLNEVSLPFATTGPGHYRIPLHHCLAGGNRVDLQFAAAAPSSRRLSGDIWLEIHEPDAAK